MSANDPGVSPRRGAASRRFGLVSAALVVLAAGFVRSVYLQEFLAADPWSRIAISDAQVYLEQAREVAATGSFTGRAYYQPPFYPFFLGLVLRTLGDALARIFVLQAVLGVMTCTLVWATALELHGPKAALAAGLLAAFFPYLPFFEARILSDSLALFLLALLLWLLVWRGGPRSTPVYALLGLLCGLATVTRAPNLLVAPVVLIDALRRLGTRKAVPPALAFVAGLALPLAPVALHNLRAEGAFLLVSGNGGENFSIGNGPEATGEYRRPAGFSADVRIQAEDALRLVGATTRAAASSAWMKKGLLAVAADPGRWLGLEARKLGLLLSGRDVPLIYHFERETADFTPVLARLAAVPYVLLLFGTFGLLAALLERSARFVVLGFLAVQVAVPLAFFVCSRFKLPVWLGLFPFAGLGMLRLGAAVRSRALGLSFLAAGGVTLAVMRLDLAYDPRPLAYHTNLGVVWTRLKAYDRADAAFAEALALAPGHFETRFNRLFARVEKGEGAGVVEEARALVAEGGDGAAALKARELLALALLRAGRLAEAEGELQAILARVPTDANARFNLAGIHARTGKPAEAERELRKGLETSPRNGPARVQLGLLLLTHEGREEEGRAELGKALELPLDPDLAARARAALAAPGEARPGAR